MKFVLPTYKLGKGPRKHDERTLKLENFLTSALPPPPAQLDWSAKVPQFLMGDNDRYGDCTSVGRANAILSWSSNAGSPIALTTEQILAFYSANTSPPFSPSDPSTDTGCVELDVLNYWKNSATDGNRIGGFVSVPDDPTIIRQAIALFGGIYIGVELPKAVQGQTFWDVSHPNIFDRIFHIGQNSEWAPGSWGGHCVWEYGYTQEEYLFASWAQKMGMSNAFDQTYVSERYALVDQAWIEDNGKAPSGLDMVALTTALTLL